LARSAQGSAEPPISSRARQLQRAVMPLLLDLRSKHDREPQLQMRSQAFFTNSVTANATPPVDLLDIPSRTDRPRYLHCQAASSRVRPRSLQSRPGPAAQMPNGEHGTTSFPVHDFSRSSLDRRFPRSKTTEGRPLVATSARNQALGSPQPRLPPAPTRTCSSRQPTSYRRPIPCAPPRFCSRVPERAFAFSILSPRQLLSHPHRCSATGREPRPLEHLPTVQAGAPSLAVETVHELPSSRGPGQRPGLSMTSRHPAGRHALAALTPISNPILLSFQPLSTHCTAFPVGITTDVKLRAHQTRLHSYSRSDRCLGRSQQGSDVLPSSFDARQLQRLVRQHRPWLVHCPTRMSALAPSRRGSFHADSDRVDITAAAVCIDIFDATASSIASDVAFRASPRQSQSHRDRSESTPHRETCSREHVVSPGHLLQTRADVAQPERLLHQVRLGTLLPVRFGTPHTK